MNLNSHIDRTRFDARQQTIEIGVTGSMFNMNAPTKTEAYATTRRELTRFMADYTNTQSAPKSVKGGWYAVVTKETGMVWLAESKNFAATLVRYRTTGIAPKEIEARRHEGLAIFLATKPIDIDELYYNLDEAGVLLERGVRQSAGAGKLYVISHSSGYYYLSKARRDDTVERDVVNRFVRRILAMRHSVHHASNPTLQNFVSECAGDLLRETGFACRCLGKFESNEQAIEMMNAYYIDQSHLKCLNSTFDNR